MSNSFGKIFKISTYGESHGPAIGVIIDGCPSGISISSEEIQKELDRRKPGQSKITTQRKENEVRNYWYSKIQKIEERYCLIKFLLEKYGEESMKNT